MPLMITELVVAIGISVQEQSLISFVKLGIVIGVWLSTFSLSVPRHGLLLKKRDEKIIESLILTNWPRTLLWSLKSLIIINSLV